MEWLSQNWLWVLFAVGMIAMHLFCHRGHGSGTLRGGKDPAPTDKADMERDSKPRSGHHH